ncbi:hypothetical protein BDR06DRAFT_365430 [Suillus hirtellus]|nr:hypothetical protein BDR06DRAFT_365430 [Suillus hirtellus]
MQQNFEWHMLCRCACQMINDRLGISWERDGVPTGERLQPFVHTITKPLVLIFYIYSYVRLVKIVEQCFLQRVRCFHRG